MPVVRLRGQLKKLAGESGDHQLDGATVMELLRALEAAFPGLDGWIVDESGAIRRHINVFVNGERATADTAVGPDDAVDVLPAISGGTTP
jgi:molybdopterin converting factor small subunit